MDISLRSITLTAILAVSGPFGGTVGAEPASHSSLTLDRVAVCTSTSLAASADWQGATGSLAGGVTLRNRGNRPCELGGRPQVSLLDAREHTLPTVPHESSDLLDAPVDRLVLLPGARAFVSIRWSNWCGGPVLMPIRIRLNLPRHTGEVWAVVASTQGNIHRAGPGARCDAPASPSTLSTGPLEPAYDEQEFVLRTYYQAVAHRWYVGAYRFLAPDNRPGFQRFTAGYRDTLNVRLDAMADPPYLIPRGRVSYTCVGVQLVAQQRNRQVRQYGGWYLVRVIGQVDARLVLSGSSVRQNVPLQVPSRETCSAQIRQ